MKLSLLVLGCSAVMAMPVAEPSHPVSIYDAAPAVESIENTRPSAALVASVEESAPVAAPAADAAPTSVAAPTTDAAPTSDAAVTTLAPSTTDPQTVNNAAGVAGNTAQDNANQQNIANIQHNTGDNQTVVGSQSFATSIYNDHKNVTTTLYHNEQNDFNMTDNRVYNTDAKQYHTIVKNNYEYTTQVVQGKPGVREIVYKQVPTPQYAAPQYAAPQYAAPQYSAPMPQQPQYSPGPRRLIPADSPAQSASPSAPLQDQQIPLLSRHQLVSLIMSSRKVADQLMDLSLELLNY